MFPWGISGLSPNNARVSCIGARIVGRVLWLWMESYSKTQFTERQQVWKQQQQQQQQQQDLSDKSKEWPVHD